MPSTRIMVVDDDTDTLEFMVDFLTAYGYQVIIGRTSSQAVRQIEQHQPVLVVLEYRLSAPNGWEIFLALRVLPTTAHIPVILYSAEHILLQPYCDKVRSMHGDVLEKPFEPEVLLAKIEALTLLSNEK